VGETIFKEKNASYDGFCVASPEEEYVVNPLVQISHEYETKNNSMIDLYEKINSGNLPPSSPGTFFELSNHFYMKYISILFHPVEDNALKEITRIIHKSAELIDAKLDENGNLMNISIETAIQRIEKIILEDKEAFSKSKKTLKNLCLAGFSALFGHLIKLGCGYEWSKAWFDEMCDVLVLHSPDKNHYMKPSKFIKREFLAERNHCELLELYNKIKNNALPPLECDWFPEEIL